MGKSERTGGRRSRDLEAPATSLSPKIRVMVRWAVIIGYAALGVDAASSAKYTSSSGVESKPIACRASARVITWCIW